MRKGCSSGARILVGCAATIAWAVAPSVAWAQAPASPPAAAPAAPAAPPAAPSTMATTDTTATPVPNDLLAVSPSGLRAEQAGARAAQSSWAAKASMESVRSAAARVDAAWASFLRRLNLLGRYTRLSDFALPTVTVLNQSDLTSGEISTLKTNIGTTAYNSLVNGFSIQTFELNNWLLQGTIIVPISDYFLRINQAYNAATHSREAAQWDVVTARAQAESNGRLAYYAWLNARGAIVVATETFNDQKSHLRDARNQFSAGNASRADVLRAETAVAAAELALEQAKTLANVSETQLRTAIHAHDDEALTPGEDLDAPPPPVQGNANQMTLEALSARPELKSAALNAEAARQLAAAAKASRYPQLGAFGDGILGDPNPRYIPATDQWNATWDFGAQLTWSPNDVLTSGANERDFESRVATIEANVNLARDGISIEVAQALQQVHVADFSIDTAKRELAAGEEAHRVARELFSNGRGGSSTLADAESDLTRARLDLLNAKVSARMARVRLEHALGRDAHPQ